MVDVRNITKGYRGLNTDAGYIDLAAGELRTGVELSGAERKSAESTGYFEFGAGAKKEPEPDAPVAPVEPSPVVTPARADDLDAMSDADLRDTVAVLTGKPAPAKADRDALLKLARA